MISNIIFVLALVCGLGFIVTHIFTKIKLLKLKVSILEKEVSSRDERNSKLFGEVEMLKRQNSQLEKEASLNKSVEDTKKPITEDVVSVSKKRKAVNAVKQLDERINQVTDSLCSATQTTFNTDGNIANSSGSPSGEPYSSFTSFETKSSYGSSNSTDSSYSGGGGDTGGGGSSGDW